MVEPQQRSNTTLTILHFNDVYNIDGDPGAACFVGQVKALAARLDPLVLFSGDAYNPSLMSTVTLGKQMVPVLNAAGVRAACVGNHEFDFGVDVFEGLAADCQFPWLLANVLDAATGEPLGGARRTAMIEHAGLRVGVVGLAEEAWVDTLACVPPESVQYVPFEAAAAAAAAELRAAGADFVIALTHMRQPNDERLAAAATGVDIVLGGHDHDPIAVQVPPHGTFVIKSGTDFKGLTVIKLTLEPPAAGADTAGTSQQQQQQSQTQSPARRLQVEHEYIPVTRATSPSDAAIEAIVKEYSAALGSRLDREIGATAVDLEGRFSAVRTRESNLGNLMTDVLRRACSADVCLLNSGTFRSDAIHPKGPLTLRDLTSILPMLDETVVIEPTGAQLLAALENGVSAWPAPEGRFLQVSGAAFAFDPSKPAGARVVSDSVRVSGRPLELARRYKVVTKDYLYRGKDGFACLSGCPVLVDSESAPTLNAAVRRFFLLLEALNKMSSAAAAAGAGNGGSGGCGCGDDGGHAATGSGSSSSGAAAAAAAAKLPKVHMFARRWHQRTKAAEHVAAPGGQAESSSAGLIADLACCGHCRRGGNGRYRVAPTVEGRILLLEQQTPPTGNDGERS